MAGPHSAGDAAGPSATVLLLAEEAVLELPATDHLLHDAARAAAAGVGLSCGITYIARYGAVTVASSDARASAVDEIQYGAGSGPCLEAVDTGAVVRVDDLATETRWGGYRNLALQAGVRSSLSLPLVLADRVIGALNVYSTGIGPLPVDQEAAAIMVGNQVTGVLQAVRGLAANLVSDPDAARDFQNRHDLGIATGMLMGVHGYTVSQALARLTAQANAEGISLEQIVARLIATGDLGSGRPS
jgi:GAF domain-containing protein